jgi:hypothetical protein
MIPRSFLQPRVTPNLRQVFPFVRSNDILGTISIDLADETNPPPFGSERDSTDHGRVEEPRSAQCDKIIREPRTSDSLTGHDLLRYRFQWQECVRRQDFSSESTQESPYDRVEANASMIPVIVMWSRFFNISGHVSASASN